MRHGLGVLHCSTSFTCFVSGGLRYPFHACAARNSTYSRPPSVFLFEKKKGTSPRDPVQQVVEDVSTRHLAMELALRFLAGANAGETQMLVGPSEGRNDPPSNEVE